MSASRKDLDWIGRVDGFFRAASIDVHSYDEFSRWLTDADIRYSNEQQSALGACAFFLALREGRGNESLLVAADRIIGSDPIALPSAVDRDAFVGGTQALRDGIFEVRNLPPEKLLEHAHSRLLGMLAAARKTT